MGLHLFGRYRDRAAAMDAFHACSLERNVCPRFVKVFSQAPPVASNHFGRIFQLVDPRVEADTVQVPEVEFIDFEGR